MSIVSQIEMHEQTIKLLRENCLDTIQQIAEVCKKSLDEGRKIILCGNGGSAADSQHIAAELVGRFVKERVSLPAIALTTDTSILTAVGNDYGYNQIFSRQVEGLGRSGDVLIGISTSGNSKNVISAFEKAKNKGIYTVAFTGIQSSKAEEIANITLRVPSNITARIQEAHILVGHIICNYIDEGF